MTVKKRMEEENFKKPDGKDWRKKTAKKRLEEED